MRLNLLSNAYLSDAIGDAPMIAPRAVPQRVEAANFPALCRGLAVLVLLSLTIGLTLLKEARLGPGLDAEAAEVGAVH